MKIVTKTFFTLLILGFIAPFAAIMYYLVNYEFDISELVEYKPAMSSRVYDRNGEKIANIFDEKHRYYASFNEIPPRAVEALLAIEDTTFFEHPGVNLDAIFRALIKDIKAGKMVEGASTITQQLVKNKLLTREKKISRKIKELIYSMRLELALSKEEILERYLNEIYFGHGYYGIKTAADGYFHKELNNLTLKEMAILVGLPKAPSTYAPTKNYDISMGRANRVISRMYALGWIDESTYNSSLNENPKVYDDTLTQNKAPFVVDEVARIMRDMGIEDFKTGGYEVHTTIDLRLQEAARESLKYAYDGSIKRLQEYAKQGIRYGSAHAPASDEEDVGGTDDTNGTRLNGAMVSIDSQTGDVLALIGSVDYEKSQFNRATQGKRQPGSSFKPFIYQVAINLGYSGASELVDIAKTYVYQQNGEEKKWQPKNYSGSYTGLVSLREALTHSNNLATINLVNEIGLSQLIQEFKKFNIKDMPNDLSISLGTLSMSPLELAKYYTSFSNAGVQVETNLISTIEKNSNTLYEKTQTTTEVTKPTQAYILTTILQDVVERGTGKNARVNGIEIAGKTGTTNNNVDGWFVGFSPSIETVVWFGNDDNSPMHRKETGGRIAGPAFAKYYEKLLVLYPQIPRKFEQPEGIIEVEIGGRKEYFSDISKPPRQETVSHPQEELLF
ncbi:PBP1A family penicillin-binding protein [bacterium]|jgi:penicillin-binding protein 1A|nr:PBP1A family penicillin-binding protein [bacterium]MBU1435379.1 PBP1A family penicillin-binding protein [bacterium]MBU1502310.1 PBP1A family penicillin-binding protein [bacterium]